MNAAEKTVLFTDVHVYDADSRTGMVGPVDVLVRGNRIAAIGVGVRSQAGAVDRVVEGRSRHLLVPGLINAHFHSPANHLKGSLPSLPLELFMLFESPADAALAPSPREAYLRTMLAALEMLRTGTTAVQDDAFIMPYPTPEIIDAVMQAYADCGIRASVALDQPELADVHKLPFLSDLASAPGDPIAPMRTPAPLGREGLLAMYDHLISTWHGAEGGRLTAAVSISAPQRVSVEYFEALDALSRAHRIPLFAHMLETKVQRALSADGERFGGRSLVRYTADLGLLSDRLNVIHAVWVDDHDLELIADAGSVIAHNPVSNLRLGSGVAPFRRMKDFGITVALGIDEAICDDSANLWGVVKTAGLIHNVSGLDSDVWPTSGEVLDSLWRGGASAMLQAHQLGEIRVGYLADLALLDLHTLPFTPLNDLRGQLVYCESGTSVRLTMVDGRVVFENGRLTTVDESALLDEARELFARKQPAIAAARESAGDVKPLFQSIVRKAADADLGMNRWIGIA
jgi:5-methylthioadenosine/S-adenosylhomocysteine deaminase